MLKIGNNLTNYIYNIAPHDGTSQSLKMLRILPVAEGAKLNYIEAEVIEGKLKFSFLADSRTADDPFNTNQRQTAKPITVLKKILPTAKLDLLNAWIEKAKAHFTVPDHIIRTVANTEIPYIYHQDNYVNGFGGSQLWQSCMRYDKCQDYLEFYTRNSNVSAVIAEINGKIAARALIWKAICNRKQVTLLDRIYAINDVFTHLLEGWGNNNVDFIKNHSKEVYLNCSTEKHEHLDIHVRLDDSEPQYPYLDTFRTLIGNRLYNIPRNQYNHRYLVDTVGQYRAMPPKSNYVHNTEWVGSVGWIDKNNVAPYRHKFVLKSDLKTCILCDINILKNEGLRLSLLDSQGVAQTKYHICQLHDLLDTLTIDDKVYKICHNHLIVFEESCYLCATMPQHCFHCNNYGICQQLNNLPYCRTCLESVNCSNCARQSSRYACRGFTNTDGVLCINCYPSWEWRCESCEGYLSENIPCEECLSSRECYNCLDYFPYDSLSDIENHLWCSDCISEELFWCSVCETYRPNEHLWEDELCEPCYYNISIICNNCGERCLDYSDYDWCNTCIDDATWCEACDMPEVLCSEQ